MVWKTNIVEALVEHLVDTLPVQDCTDFATFGQNAINRTLNRLASEIGCQKFKLRFPPHPSKKLLSLQIVHFTITSFIKTQQSDRQRKDR